MNQKVLSVPVLAFYNLKAKPFRTALLILLAALLSFVLLAGSVLSFGLWSGTKSTSARLGADLMIVPKDYEKEIEGALLRGEPSTFYFEDDVAARIASTEGVGKVTGQLYIGSLKEPCCQLNIQLIGFDPATDFIVGPLLSDKYKKPLGYGEIAVGSLVDAKVGESLKFFDREYRIVARLAETGMGFDTSVFMNMESARELVERSEKIAGNSGADVSRRLSSVMVETEKGYEAKAVSEAIVDQYRPDPEVKAIVSQSLLSNASKTLDTLLAGFSALGLGIWIFVILVFILIFHFAVNERKREFGILRALGATRKKLSGLILMESFYISAFGAAAGLLCGSLIFPFSTFIRVSAGLPYLLPDPPALIGLYLAVFAISAASGPLAALYAARRIGKAEAYLTIRENE